jgi:hypothetical protein
VGERDFVFQIDRAIERDKVFNALRCSAERAKRNDHHIGDTGLSEQKKS